MERVFFRDKKGDVTREFCIGPGLEIFEHIHTPDGRFLATYQFEEFRHLASGPPSEALETLIQESLFPTTLRIGPTIPGDRKEKLAPKNLRSFVDPQWG